MHVLHAWALLLLVWVAQGQAAPNPKQESSNPNLEDDDAVVAELARRLRPLESLESKHRRLEELEARQNMLSNLESSHRSQEGAESQYGGCGGGCSKGRVRSKVADELEAEYRQAQEGLRPRPIFGLLNNLIETARYGYMSSNDVHGRTLRERRSPDSSEEHSWTDTFKNTFDKAKAKVSETIDDVRESDAYAKVKEGVSSAGDKIKEGVSTAGDKLSEIGQNIKNSDAYEKVSSELHSAGEKLSKVGDNIRESDTYQGVKSSFNKAADNIKEKLDD